MRRGDGLYSRVIAWLKILFPLGALVLLSTIFLFSRSTDPISTLPVLSGGVDPSRGEQVGRPFYAGTTDRGHELTLAARQARGMSLEDAGLVAEDVRLGRYSAQQARALFGVAIGADGTVDGPATDALRLRG